MTSTSFWKAISQKKQNYPKLEGSLEVDVAIIGGGITGITAAHQLLAAGKKIAVIDNHEIGGMTTSSSTGNLYVPVQPFYQSIYEKFDLETARTIAHSRQFAIDYIEQIVNEKNIQCQFKKRPWYAYTDKTSCERIDKEVELLQRINIPIQYTKELPLQVPYKKAVVLPNQARFNPLQYVISLAEDLHERGCYLFENTRVLEVQEKSKCIVRTEKGMITAKKVFIATHTPLGINITQAYTAPYRSYVVAVRLNEDKYPEGHFWDLDKPPHAICTHAITKEDPELLMVAGSHHKTGQGKSTVEHAQELVQFMQKTFPVKEIAYQWSAQHFQSADSVPYIGLAHHSSHHTYMATGYFADGLVYGTLAGIIIADVLTNNSNNLLDTYQAQRHDFVASASFLMKENTNVFFQYLKDLPLLINPKYQDLKPGEGCIVQIRGEKCAVSRDADNNLHVVSAVCTHMKGIVNWNTMEQSWDCPCHGSRFAPNGELLEGPAIINLQRYSADILKNGD
ncbi:MAG: FAD-dependent oxidoreductase [Legionella sp.]|nr:MAG: FAD-dependent oxidoreductase [Legionella sp.]